MSRQRRKALIVLSSAKVLPLAEPTGHPGIPTGFFLCELGQVLEEFGDDHDFTFVTPDGEVPQLDVNGLALPWHATGRLLSATARTTVEGAFRFDVDTYRARRPDLVARRAAELDLAYRYLGNIPVSAPLPRTDKEAVALRDDVVAAFAALPRHEYQSIPRIMARHRDPADEFDLGEFDFVHLPGGHAPMVDFVDDPWMGELLNTLHEHGVLISLICHGPIAMASAKYRVDADGGVRTTSDHPFAGIRLTTVPKYGEVGFSRFGFLKFPGLRTRVTYYVDEALVDAGFKVEIAVPNPGAVKVVWEPDARVLTGNGPQAVDEQCEALRTHLGDTTRPGAKRSSA
ncbi:DJ-1/PfpI family protein [Umezawaea sp. NPDC059074]|uniref:DJ-1/PfpI family protein n=1 Tax=Umezawaea sp. NPDC059074 TaxID=3346716 RepID=UPI0036876D51